MLDVVVTGHLDLCGPDLVEGWLLWQDKPSERLKLQIFVDGILLGECIADRFREDLAKAGMGDGHCGFSFKPPTGRSVKDAASVRLRVSNSVLYLLPDEFTTLKQ